jgi:hypothetical protein
MSKSDPLDSELVNYERVEYKKYYDKTNTQTEIWTNLNVLIVAKNRKPNWDVYIYSNTRDMSSINNSRIMNMFSRDKRKYEEEGFKVKFMNRRYWDENHSVFFNMANMMFKTKIKMESTKWTMTLMVSASRFSEFKENDHLTISINVLKDSYTINNSTLMSYYIEDAFGDMITVRELLDDVPDLKTLDNILIRNDWIMEFKILSSNRENNTKNTADKYTVKAINESFGIQSMRAALMTLVPNDIMESMKEDPDLNNKMEDFNASDIKNNMSAMESFLDALKNKEDESSDDYNTFEEFHNKSSIIKIVDQMCSESMVKTIDVDRKKMSEYLKTAKVSNASMNRFHNVLLWMIRDEMDYEISNVMSLILYNCILKNFVTTFNIKPKDEIKWFGIEMRKSFDNNQKFIKRKKDNTVIQEIMEDFD